MTILLAGDVGATKTNVALYAVEPDGLRVVVAQSFLNRDHPTLEGMVAEFVAAQGRTPAAACFGIAGPVVEGRSRMPNLAWTIEAVTIARALGIERVVLLNDLEATGYGIATLAEDDFVVLNRGMPRTGANAAVIAAGTGLGEAILFWDGTRYRVCASEGGHADFGPRGQEQERLLTRLSERFDHVSYERLVSGPGLHNIYQALDGDEPAAVSERIATATDPSAAIAEAALAGNSSRCVRSLDVFVACYGAEAGNLALKSLATAGVYVGGGIAPKIIAKLTDGTFVRAFCDKGRFATMMKDIPVKVILDPTTALRGSAAYLAHMLASASTLENDHS